MFKVKNKRETGFEILRILAIYLIIVVHLLNSGGMLANARHSTLIWHKLLYAFFTPAVNVFVMVSAYFMVTSKVKYKKLFFLWCLAVFYCTSKYLMSSIFIYDNFSTLELISCFFPIIRNKYWFFTAYFLLMLISPFINKIMNNSSKKELYLLSLFLIVLTYLSMKHPIGSIFNLGAGYTLWWFVCLYVFAGTLKLYPLKISKIIVLIVYLVATALLWLCNIAPTNNYWLSLFINSFDYTSVLVIIASVSLLLLFKGVNIKNVLVHNTICYISSLTFGIYLIEGAYLHDFWHFNVFKIQNFYASVCSPLFVLLVALETFVLFALVEAVRKLIVKLFQKNFKKIKNTE